ncbi:MAG: hypothetical protein ACI88A_004274 [Paraglaciecola sp.]
MIVLIFNKHGDYRITFDGHVLLIEGEGPWNKETVLSYVDEIKSIQVKYSDSCLGLICALQGESIVTFDAKEALQNLQHWRIINGYVYPIAFVFIKAGERSFYEALFRDIHKDTRMAPRFFPSVEQARRWLMDVRNNS